MSIKIIRVLLIILLCKLSFADSQIDSLKNVIQQSNFDTVKINALYELANYFYLSNTDTTIIICEKAIDLSLKNNFKKGLCEGYGWLGYLQIQKSNIPKSSEYYKKSIEIYKELNDEKGIALCYHNLGYNSEQLGNIIDALHFYEKALKIREKINDIQGVAYSLNNLAYLYDMQGETQKAISYNERCLKIYTEIKDTLGISYSLNNLGNIYDNQGDKQKTIDFYSKSLQLRKKINAKKVIAESYLNFGSLYKDLKQYEKAIDYYKNSLLIFSEIGNEYGKASVLNQIGDLYFSLGNNFEAKNYAQKSIDISRKIGFPATIRDAANLLAKIYKQERNFNKGWEYFELYILMKDSVQNNEIQKKAIKQLMKYEFDRQIAIDSVRYSKEIEIKDLKLTKSEEIQKKQKVVIYTFIFGFLIILVFSLLLYRMFIQKKRANKQLAQKNIEVEQKNEEITAQRDEISAQRDLVTQQKIEIEHIHEELTDSINYAKRIQEAVLPISEEYRSIMGEHFILFRPKDIVSGDFYWTAKIENILIVTVADCTGHGVPGAFMSMLGISFLNEIIRNKAITNANEVLNELRKEIINALQQKGQSGEQKDGMDMSLLAIDTISHEAQWAGANNPLWVVKSSKPQDTNLKTQENSSLNLEFETCFLELKADKMPIAIYEKMDSFTNHEITLEKGDSVYLMSDGYEDQFGGPKGKKFLSKNLKQLLIVNCQLPMEQQKQVLEKTLVDWIGEGEQIDDITVLGIKI